MPLRGDDRAQTVQIGAVLLFATLVVAASLYQAAVVPAQNEGVEYAAYEDASSDMTRLRNAMLAAASGDGTRAVTVKTGAQYDSRIFFINPLQPSGAVSTTAAANVTIRNVTVSSGELRSVGEYLAAEDGTLNYTTRRVRFAPDYNELTAAPIVSTNGFVYREHSRPTPLATQTLVRGNTITLRTVVGDLDASGYTAPITAVPVSAHVNTVTVTNNASRNLTLTVPTRLDASDWESTVLSGQTDRYVEDVRPGPRPNTVTVVLAANETYELRIARIALTERNDDAAAESPRARYLVSHTDREVTTNDDGRVKLSVEARDALNNPVSNANVTFSSPAGKFETASGETLSESPTVRTNEAGNAVVYYNATDYVGNLPVTATLGRGGSVSAEKRVQYEVTNTVTSTGGGSSGEQAGRNLVVLEDVTIARNQPTDTITYTINSTGEYPINITGYRLDFHTVINKDQFSDGADAINQVVLDPETSDEQARPATDSSSVAYESRSPYFLENPINLTSGSHELQVVFDEQFEFVTGGGGRSAILVSYSLYLEGGITVTYTTHVVP